MAAAADDLLSSLPDDLLRRILYFAPAKEAASTCVLSRRWRSPLWLTSGAVNLDTRSYVPKPAPAALYPHLTFLNELKAGHEALELFLCGAEAALAAVHAHGGGPVRRLTVHVEAASRNDSVRQFLTDERYLAVFSHPAVRRVEELCVTAMPEDSSGGGNHELRFPKLPHEALRVLHVTNFTDLKPPRSGAAAAAFFPHLTELRLQGCFVTFTHLQRVVDAAPHLATLHLESTSFPRVNNVQKDSSAIEERLVCPAVTDLVFANCKGYGYQHEGGLEIEAPRLRYFRYAGLLLVNGQLLLKLLSVSNLIQADLHLSGNPQFIEKQIPVFFWEFIHDLSAIKVLRLKIDFAIDYVGIVGDEVIGNKFFHNLERLDLEGCYEPAGSNNAAITIANFVHYCPVIRDLCLKLHKVSEYIQGLPSVGTQAQLDFNMSVDRFKRRRRAMILLGGDDDDRNHEVSDIPALSEHSFDCLQSCLRRVRLQFRMDEPNCFGVQLAKFFTNSVAVLEEIHIDDGNHKMREHMNSKVRILQSKRRPSPSISSFGKSYKDPRKRLKR